MEFKGVEKSKNYSEGKSSGEVFRKAHEEDYLAGYNQALKDSFAAEMLEVLNEVKLVIINSDHWWIDCPNKGGFDLCKIDDVIKKATDDDK